MNTALANNQGELVIPVIITGTFQHPQFAPDVQKIAQMKLQHLLPNTGNPGGLVSGILGNVLGQRGGQAAPNQNQPAQQNQNPVDALGKVLNQVIGGNKQQQNQQQPPQK